MTMDGMIDNRGIISKLAQKHLLINGYRFAKNAICTRLFLAILKGGLQDDVFSILIIKSNLLRKNQENRFMVYARNYLYHQRTPKLVKIVPNIFRKCQEMSRQSKNLNFLQTRRVGPNEPSR